MCSSADVAPDRVRLPREVLTYDGVLVSELAERLAVPALHCYAQIGSTLDAAHALAPGAPSGTLVVADEQTAGRGRQGRPWASRSGGGVWLTLIERPADQRALDVLAIRCGLYAAETLESLADAPIRVKWPNDLYVGTRKLAGILIETRWRGTAPDWVAIGFGLNVTPPALETATGLASGVSRLAALERLVPALRAAATASRHLSDDELVRWRARDLAVDRDIDTPQRGRVTGIQADGQLLVASPEGVVSPHRTGSITFAG